VLCVKEEEEVWEIICFVSSTLRQRRALSAPPNGERKLIADSGVEVQLNAHTISTNPAMEIEG
jgi:hypothetical protein